ncbi:MAG TPA: matrixin family metalloprotease [Ktedonobacteraceae bacterium]|jgi:predicted Zn-dependent protease|nr:matrixin family metalloprotease [Ktedonobacteraceae bacterium]
MHPRRFFSQLLPFCFALMLVSFISTLRSPIIFANYSFDGGYWPNNFAIQYIKDSMTSKDSAGFTNGINAWNNDPYAPVYFVGYSGGNHVEMWDQNDGNDGYDGYSWRDTSSFGCNVNGTTVYVIAYAAAYLNTYYTNQSKYTSGGAVQSVAAHELGHDVGLGHDPNENQLMYATTDRWWVDGINSPQSDDNAGVNAIYSKC